jgi:hypothetical protein
MKNALVIAAREFEEKRFVAYAAVAIAAVPFIFAAIPAIGGKSPRETIAMGSLVFGTGFAVALALMTGASFVGRDLSDGRLSFYFSRPVSAASIWFGKLAAGILMVVGCFVIIITPAWLAAGKSWTTFLSFSLAEGSGVVLTVALGLFLAAHVISTFARSRSPLISIDIAAAVLCGVAIRFLVLPLAAGRAEMLIAWLGIFLLIALAVAIVGGGAWQLERGRTDRRRNHLALSQFLWGTMAVALLIAAGCVAWVVSAKPSDLTTRIIASHRAGSPFLILTGRARNRGDYNAAYLIDLGDGSARRIDPDVWGTGGVEFTRDGRSLIAPRQENHSEDLVIYKRGSTEPAETGLTLPLPYRFFASDDGNRIATIVNGNLSIYDVSQKRSLVSVRAPSDGRFYCQGYFLSPDVFRLYVHAQDGLSIYELDTRVRGLKATGAITNNGFVNFALDPTVSRMIVRRHNVDDITLNDARSGAVIKTIGGKNVLNYRFLRDGRMAIVEGPPSKTTLHIFSPDGSLQRDIPFDGGERVGFVGDDGTRVVLSVANKENSLRTLVAINLDRGVIERSERIVLDWTMAGTWESRPPIEPLREVIYGDGAGHIVAWNPVTGARRMVTGG